MIRSKLEMTRTLILAIALLLGFASASPTLALTTVFGPGGGVGLPVPDASVLNGFETFTTFGGPNGSDQIFAGTPNLGKTLFFQSQPFYVGSNLGTILPSPESGLPAAFGNNRAYGVIGSGRSDIVFAPGSVTDLLVQARGTNAGATLGGSPAVNPELGPGAILADAVASLLVYSELGFEFAVTLSTAGFETISIDVSRIAGESITRLSLVNQGPANSAVVLGELTVVPEPGTALLMGLGLAGLASARRRD